MAHPRTEDEIRARLDEIDGQISELLAAWENLVDYSIGGKRLEKTAALEALRRERDSLLDKLAALPAEEPLVYDDPDL